MENSKNDPEDILMLWQSEYGPLDEELREEFLHSDLVDELCYFHIDIIQNAILAKNVRLRDILTYAYVHPYKPELQENDLNSFQSEPEVGAYFYSGKIYSVRRDRKTGTLQAWEFDKSKKEYRRPFFSADERKIIYSLRPSARLTLKTAQKHSIETGICCHCGRYLTAERSVANGMGPVCRRHYH